MPIKLIDKVFEYPYSPVNIEFTIERYVNVLEGKEHASREMVDKIDIDKYVEFWVTFNIYIQDNGDFVEAIFSGLKEDFRGCQKKDKKPNEDILLSKMYNVNKFSKNKLMQEILYIFLIETISIYRIAESRIKCQEMDIYYRFIDLRGDNAHCYFGDQEYRLACIVKSGDEMPVIINIVNNIYRQYPLVVPF